MKEGLHTWIQESLILRCNRPSFSQKLFRNTSTISISHIGQRDDGTYPKPFNASLQARAGSFTKVFDVEAEIECLQKPSREDQISVIRGKLYVENCG